MAMLLLGGCRQEEQGRIQNYQPGKYLGRSDTALDQETRDDLRTRIRYQSGAQSGGGGAPTSTSSSVRPPTAGEGVSAGARAAARVRVKKQGSN
jgi:hypothetical protein